MTETFRHNEETLAELLRALPPAPEGWVRAAQELPRSRRELDDIVARAVADEAALRDVGYAPDSLPLEELKRRLSSAD
jgi:hypothetical protein